MKTLFVLFVSITTSSLLVEVAARDMGIWECVNICLQENFTSTQIEGDNDTDNTTLGHRPDKCCVSDLNRDGRVSLCDLIIMKTEFNTINCKFCRAGIKFKDCSTLR